MQKLLTVTVNAKQLVECVKSNFKIEDEQLSFEINNNLKDINEKLWIIEDNIRVKEKLQQFDSEFIDLARQVYITNDERAKIKKQINLKSKSYLIEEKSYEF